MASALLWGMLALAAAGPAPGDARLKEPEKPPKAVAVVRDLTVFQNSGDLYASFSLDGAFVPRVLEKIRSGIQVTFTYRLEMLRKRTWWFDEVVVERKVETLVLHDPMSGRYELKRLVDGVESASEVTEEEGRMRVWMTRIQRVPLVGRDRFPPEGRVVLRVRAKVFDDFVMLFIPWDYVSDWQKLFVRPDALPLEAPPDSPGG